jgi:hypothetical protein
MKFRYELDVKKMPEPINHRHKLLLIGSCFTENIGEKLDRYKFTTLQNPNGILFNPVSVAEALTDIIEQTVFTEADLFYLNEAWHSWKHHSRFSAVAKTDSLQKINDSIATAYQFLKEADYLVITLGSAWIYTLTEKAANGKPGAVAANNHKAPSTWFSHRLLTMEDVLRVLDNVLHRLFLFNRKLKVVFTISPVRHLREGAVENNRSKAVLIQAVHHLVAKFDKLYYFPAYELVIDDLRDYRFYSEDLVHPNYFATQYVWEKLVGACMDEKTKGLIDEIHAINLAFQHKPFQESSEAHKAFKRKYLSLATNLQQQFPFLDLHNEIAYFGS